LSDGISTLLHLQHYRGGLLAANVPNLNPRRPSSSHTIEIMLFHTTRAMFSCAFDVGGSTTTPGHPLKRVCKCETVAEISGLTLVSDVAVAQIIDCHSLDIEKHMRQQSTHICQNTRGMQIHICGKSEAL